MATNEVISIVLILVIFLSGFVPIVMGIIYYTRENRRLDREERERRKRPPPTNKLATNYLLQWTKVCNTGFPPYFCTPFNSKAMSVTRLKRKNRKDKAKSARRRQSLKLQNFQPVMKTVDVEKIKEEFKARKKAA